MVSLANRVQRDFDTVNQSQADSEVSTDSSMSIDHSPKSIEATTAGSKVFKLRSVPTIHRTEKVAPPVEQDSKPSGDSFDDEGDDAPPPLRVGSDMRGCLRSPTRICTMTEILIHLTDQNIQSAALYRTAQGINRTSQGTGIPCTKAGGYVNIATIHLPKFHRGGTVQQSTTGMVGVGGTTRRLKPVAERGPVGSSQQQRHIVQRCNLPKVVHRQASQ